MISRPDKQISGMIPKKANFTLVIPTKDIVSTEEGFSIDGKSSIVLENMKSYDPSSDLKSIKEKFKDYSKDELDSFMTFTFPERLLYEEHALEMRALVVNPGINPNLVLSEMINPDEFESKEEALIVNDRINAAIKLVAFMLSSTLETNIPLFEDAKDNIKDNPSYIYKISESSMIGEYAITKTEYDLFGYDNVLVCEFNKMPELDNLSDLGVDLNGN